MQTPNNPWWRVPAAGVGAMALLTLVSLFALWRLAPPDPLPADAELEFFSAGRAMKDLQWIAAEPHPAGSEAHARVREGIERRFREMQYEVRTEDGLTTDYPILNDLAKGRVVNVVARIPGSERDPSRAVLIVAHYDSVPISYGAADDGAGVAAILETARALTQQPRLRNDVIFLVTDAEELCLCGAKMFAKSDPWAAEVAVVVNFEARGVSGPSIMFETSPDNRALISQYATAANHPAASSLSYEVYRRMPNNTDLTVFKKAGYPGVNFAFIGEAQNYHTPNDTIEHLDIRSLQHHGENMLSLARRFGDSDLGAFRRSAPEGGGDIKDESKPAEANAANAVYFDVLSWKVARYPDWLNWPLAVLGVAALAGVAWAALRGGRVTRGGIIAGALFVPVALGALIAFEQVRLRFFAVASSGRHLPPEVFNNASFAALALGVAALMTAAMIALARRWNGFSLAVGAWIWIAILWVACVVAVPGATYLFAWPLLFGVGTMAWRLWADAPGRSEILTPRAAFAISALGAVPAAVIFTPVIYLVFLAMSLRMFAAIGALIIFASIFALPSMDVTRRE